jgi:hypothetical protein
MSIAGIRVKGLKKWLLEDTCFEIAEIYLSS